MLKRVIKHADLDGNPTETVCYFNLTKAEVIELNIRTDLEVVGQAKDQNMIMDAFKRILQMSYGKRTTTGEFIKEGFPAFAASEAYSELFMNIWQDPSYASEFIKGILPAGILPVEEGQQETRSNIPESMRNHPSMQSNLAPKHSSSKESVQEAIADPKVYVAPPSMDPETDKGYQDYLAYKASLAEQGGQSESVPDNLI